VLLVVVGRWTVSLVVVVGGGSIGGTRWMVVVRGGHWWFRHVVLYVSADKFHK